jgi:hypothetical protein
MTPESQELQERIKQSTDEQLLEMVAAEPGEYRQEAIGFAKAELDARGVDYAPEPPETVSERDLNARGDIPVCLVCGGRLRPGTLVGEKEITIVFTDNKEERFVRVDACTQCGLIALAVDNSTDVQAS